MKWIWDKDTASKMATSKWAEKLINAGAKVIVFGVILSLAGLGVRLMIFIYREIVK